MDKIKTSEIIINDLILSEDTQSQIQEALTNAVEIHVESSMNDIDGLKIILEQGEDIIPFDQLVLNMPSKDLITKEFGRLMARVGFVGGCLATVAGSVILAKSIKAIKAKTKGTKK